MTNEDVSYTYGRHLAECTPWVVTTDYDRGALLASYAMSRYWQSQPHEVRRKLAAGFLDGWRAKVRRS